MNQLSSALSSTAPGDPLAAPRPARPRRAGSLARGALATGAAVALLLIGAGAADAHVRVKPDSTTTGSYSALTFRVPNESATAGTISLSVTLPTDNPFLSVSTKPVPGWTATTEVAALPKPVDNHGTTITKAIRTVTWAADPGVQIAPGQYQEFSISVGPLPAPGTVILPATQTYSDGTVVKWDQPTTAGATEPAHPAPQFVVTAADTTTSGSDHSSGAHPSAQPEAAAAPTGGSDGSDGTARLLGGLGLVAGLGGVGIALAGRRREAGGSGTEA